VLNREQLEEAVKKVRLPREQWDKRFTEIGGGLGPARTALHALVNARRRALYTPHHDRTAAAAAALASLTPDQARRLTAELFPNAASAVWCAWKSSAHQPVTTADYGGRRAFRAPSDTALLARRRAELLATLTTMLNGVDQPPLWIARRAAAFESAAGAGRVIAELLAGAIDAGGLEGTAVRDQLIEAAWGRDAESGPTNVGLYALMLCHDLQAWDTVVQLVESAKREEGLRQRIVEFADESQPDLFRRILGKILDEDLLRFSAIARAVDVWFGLNWDSSAQRSLTESVQCVTAMLDDPARRAKALESGTPHETWFALWCTAYEDLVTAVNHVDRIVSSGGDPLRRCVALDVLIQSRMNVGQGAALTALADPDLRVCARAVAYFSVLVNENRPGFIHQPESVFDACEKLLARVPKDTPLPEGAWTWDGRNLGPQAIVGIMAGCLTPPNVARILPHAAKLDPSRRAVLAITLSGARPKSGKEHHGAWSLLRGEMEVTQPPTDAVRALLIAWLGDASTDVRRVCAKILSLEPLKPDEADRWTELLSRKQADIRKNALERLATLKDPALLEAAARLTADKDRQRNAAGVEILRTMIQAKRSEPKAAAALAASNAKPDVVTASSARAAKALDLDPRELSRATCFGLVPNPPEYAAPAPQPSAPETPRKRSGLSLGALVSGFTAAITGAAEPAEAVSSALLPASVLRMTDAAWSVVAAYARIVAANLDKPVTTDTGSAENARLIGEVSSHWSLQRPARGTPAVEQRARFGLYDQTEKWLVERAPQTRDTDGLELLRAFLYLRHFTSDRLIKGVTWPDPLLRAARRDGYSMENLYEPHLQWVSDWAFAMTRSEAADSARAEAVWSDAYALIVAHRFGPRGATRVAGNIPPGGELIATVAHAETVLRECCGQTLSDAHSLRVWHAAVTLRRALRSEDAERARKRIGTTSEYSQICQSIAQAINLPFSPAVEDAARALDAGAATTDQFIDSLVGECWGEPQRVSSLTRTGVRIGWRKHAKTVVAGGAAVASAHRVIARIVELELLRGEAPLPSTPFAAQLSYAGDADACIRCLVALDGEHLTRSVYHAQDRLSVLSRLIQRTLPGENDTPERFAQLTRGAGIKERALVELAVYAPQWAHHAEHALAWPGLTDAVWWVHAHTKGDDWAVDADVQALWDASIAERTPVPIEDLKAGVVDAAWFHRVHELLGNAHWLKVYAAAKYACSGVGHKRAQLFADAMTGASTAAEITDRIAAKRHQDSIRALGLCPLPLPVGSPEARAAVLNRYKVIQEIKRTSSKHGGSMLQASEKRAVESGMDNLARAAGYPDPLRLQWAMEIEHLGPLSKGPMSATVAEVTVTLGVEDGEAELVAVKKGKKLASIPPALKKDETVAPLIELNRELKKSASRVRKALEEAMCRADTFRADEVRGLSAHPILWPMVQRLVLVAPTGAMGYPDNGGRTLRDHAGQHEPLKDDDLLRLAHPHDLYTSKEWHLWQRDCFAAERVQPFKQVFRELYLPTATEGPRETGVTRYAGNQVQPRQALALLGTRNWVARPEEGVFRSFHAEKIVAWIEFMESFYTPADVEGLTVERIHFTHVGKWERLPLGEIPPRLFSEVMRDIDLVVSVAYRGGVDPETSESTVESRGALIRETAMMLGLKNVRVEKQRAFIEGTIRPYTVHLGSGVVHMMPGGQVWIVPVHAAHRGRIFLPFADSDPKTAEVVSKVLLLARDNEIKDPGIVGQLRA
jgi:hypothetical protein